MNWPALKNQREHIAQLERDKEAVLEHYAAIAPEALDLLAPEERKHLYKMLRLTAVQHPDGTVEVEMSGVDLVLCLKKYLLKDVQHHAPAKKAVSTATVILGISVRNATTHPRTVATASTQRPAYR